MGPSRALLAAPSPPSNAPPRGGSPPPLSRGSAGVAGRAKRCSASRTADRNSCGAEGGVGTTGPAPQRPPRPPSAPPAHLVSQIAVIAEAPLEAARLREGGAVRGRHSARPPPLSPPGAPPRLSPPPRSPAALPWQRRRRKWRERDANPRPRRAALRAERVGGPKSARGAALKGAASPPGAPRALLHTRVIARAWGGGGGTHGSVRIDVDVHARIGGNTRENGCIRVHAHTSVCTHGNAHTC